MEQYGSCRGLIAAENWKSARILNHILMVLMGIYAVLSLTGVINRSFAAYYGITLVYTVLVEVLFLTAVASGDILNAFSFFLVAGFLLISSTGSESGIIWKAIITTSWRTSIIWIMCMMIIITGETTGSRKRRPLWAGS